MSLAGSLRGNDLQGLLNEVRGLARRQPALLLGTSMAAGFAAARVGRRISQSYCGAPEARRLGGGEAAMASGRIWKALGIGIAAAALVGRSPPSHRGLGQRRLAAAGGIGMEADGSSEVPPSGWWQVIKRVAMRIGEDRLLAEAASVTYYTLLAIFPALAALISLYGLVADPSTIGKTLDGLSGILPAGGMQILNDQIHSLTSTPNKALGVGAVIGLATSIWSANAGVKSLFDALNSVYEQREKRSFLQLTKLSLLFTLGALMFVMLAVSAVVVVPAILNYVGFATFGTMLLAGLRWPLLLGAFGLFLAFTYKYGPCRARARWQWVSWGSAFAAITWVGGSALFSWYVANFGSYNKTYGSLGAAVGFMTWIWISTIIVLIGAELNAELERQTARDSTPGRRRATRADEIAAA